MKPDTKVERATVSINAEILACIDEYVKTNKHEGLSRSSVFEEAACLWLQRLRDEQDYEYFRKNADSLNADDESWSRIAAEAAKEIFK